MDITIEYDPEMGYKVYEFGVYGSGSVLAGQTRKSFLDVYDTLEDAQLDYPDAAVIYRDANNHFDHLPDDSDY